jgi:aryl-alcohol dehydrogenase (NADP+)
VHAALDAGISFVDTADAYPAGESERIRAKALSGRRDEVVLATKCFFPTGRDVNEGGGSRRWIVRAVEESLRRLGTDWIDVYQESACWASAPRCSTRSCRCASCRTPRSAS